MFQQNNVFGGSAIVYAGSGRQFAARAGVLLFFGIMKVVFRRALFDVLQHSSRGHIPGGKSVLITYF